ncbi:YcaO-like family protein [Psychromicrobium sp. YIM B11713]|uniref:YcaO-like family protein n=1 Tax=Psychromicrobium sp. YIM B11713 TaxID=3145233 RepID=UPI00374F0CBD
MFTAVLSDAAQFSPWNVDSAGAGYSLRDDAAALAPAIGEAVERYCAHLVPPELRRASVNELQGFRANYLDPREFKLFDETQFAQPKFPFRKYLPDEPLEWISGRRLSDDQPVLLPADLVWISYPYSRRTLRGKPILPSLVSGLAAGTTQDEALWSALCQLIERDTLTLAWSGRATLTEIIPPAYLAAWGEGARKTLKTRFFQFPNEFGLQVVGALVADLERGYLTMGASCKPSLLPAMEKALAEALQLQLFSADLDDPSGAYMKAAHSPMSPLKPWRENRDYLTSFQPDLSDVVEYLVHLQLYLDPRMQSDFHLELESSLAAESVDWRQLAGDESAAHNIPGLISKLDLSFRQLGILASYADLTTPDVGRLGWSVVQVLAPGLYSNSSAGLPFLGGDRLQKRLAERGDFTRRIPLPH